MDYLLAKIKGRNGGLSMVLSDETVFDCVPDFSNARAYDDGYKLQDGEWFVVDEFSTKSYCLDVLKTILMQPHTLICPNIFIERLHTLFLFRKMKRAM